jgi:hypothetical protein
MTLETAAIATVGAVTSGLVYVAGLLWRKCEAAEKKGEKCEEDRDLMQGRIENLERATGLAEGQMQAYQRCPYPQCPFKTPPARYASGQPISNVPTAPP